MAFVNFFEGTQNQISSMPFKEGAIYFATDLGCIAYDLNGTRKWSSVIKHGTVEYWNQQKDYCPSYGELIVYDDYKTYTEDDKTYTVPGIKVGDNNAYLIDLPFIDSYISKQLSNHINDTVKHITDEERNFWNNKVTCFLDNNLPDTLIFSKTV